MQYHDLKTSQKFHLHAFKENQKEKALDARLKHSNMTTKRIQVQESHRLLVLLTKKQL